MPTYLLSWNPNNWQWPDLADAAARVAAGERIERRWSCGNTKVIQAGDRFFLIRLGKTPRGIFGAGYVTSPPFYEPHWDGERRAKGDVTLYVMVEFDWLLDPEEDFEEMIPFRYLETEPRFAGMKWRLQKSGARIPDAVAAAVEVEIRQASADEYLLPTELADAGLPTEGAKKTITVDARERSAKARRQAIALHGVTCTVCGFNFADYYGTLGDGYIEVHHLSPLADAQGERPVDSAADLRPVCPNCHAMLHWRTATTREIGEVRESIDAQIVAGRVSFSWRRGG